MRPLKKPIVTRYLRSLLRTGLSECMKSGITTFSVAVKKPKIDAMSTVPKKAMLTGNPKKTEFGKTEVKNIASLTPHHSVLAYTRKRTLSS